MRRAAYLVMLSLLILVTWTPASVAMRSPARADDPARAAELFCQVYVASTDLDRRVHLDLVENDQVVDSQRSKGTLGFTPTAWGFHQFVPTADGSSLRFNAVAANGVPRRVTVDLDLEGKVLRTKAEEFSQGEFLPRLFADGYTNLAYTVNQSGALQRWSLLNLDDGGFKYGQKVTIGVGFDDLTSLQAADVFATKGGRKEFLYATTTAGELLQISVPLKHPKDIKVRTLLATGYAGVTELSWSVCNKENHHVVVGVDPAAGTATWTTIDHAIGKPETKLRGSVAKGPDWHVTAVF